MCSSILKEMARSTYNYHKRYRDAEREAALEQTYQYVMGNGPNPQIEQNRGQIEGVEGQDEDSGEDGMEWQQVCPLLSLGFVNSHKTRPTLGTSEMMMSRTIQTRIFPMLSIFMTTTGRMTLVKKHESKTAKGLRPSITPIGRASPMRSKETRMMKQTQTTRTIVVLHPWPTCKS
jgi:hypothetical protein